MEVIIDGRRYVPSVELPSGFRAPSRINPLGSLVATYREANSLSLQEAANRAGVSKTYLWEIETGKATDPPFAIIVRLARAYGINLNTLAEAVP
jgi:transcriptional regulator with XRE-family HTH domain